MAKKDTAATVLGMLSTTGASTRPIPDDDEAAGDAAAAHQQQAATVEELPVVVESTTPTTGPRSPGSPRRKAASPPAARRRRAATPTDGSAEAGSEVPRTLRLRASTAAALRDAWLAAKREDVLLSHQDFASDLLDAALTRSRTPGR